MKARIKFVWQDLWVGVFVKTNPINPKYRFVLYVCILPMLPIEIIFYK